MSNMEASLTPISSTDDTPQVVGDGAATLPSCPPTSGKIKPIRKASEVWKHFIKEPFELGSNIGPRASWKYCCASYACDPIKNGTSTMMQHLRDKCTGGCPLREENKQKVLVFDNKGTVVAHSYSKESSRIACVKMIILDELPFRHVEGVGFRLFMRECQPRFDPPSRRTIARDVWDLSHEENVKSRVGEAIGRLVEDCLHDWGIDKVFTITLDNATANDRAIRHMKRQLKLWGTLLLDEAALKLQKGFDRLEEEAADYASYFHQSGGDRDDGIPKKKKRKVQEREICTKKKLKPSTVVDWEYARAFVKFLKIF
ncbi:unnamed protein product [Prunus armeniaca]